MVKAPRQLLWILHCAVNQVRISIVDGLSLLVAEQAARAYLLPKETHQAESDWLSTDQKPTSHNMLGTVTFWVHQFAKFLLKNAIWLPQNPCPSIAPLLCHLVNPYSFFLLLGRKLHVVTLCTLNKCSEQTVQGCVLAVTLESEWMACQFHLKTLLLDLIEMIQMDFESFLNLELIVFDFSPFEGRVSRYFH